MGTLLPWAIATVICAITCVVLFLLAIARKRFSLFYLSLGMLLATGLCAIVTAYLFAGRSYGRIRGLLAPRTGIEIYTDLLGMPPDGCVEVINAQDQVIPKIDTAIRLHAHICPTELRRILSEGGYSMERTTTTSTDGAGIAGAFSASFLGDTVLHLQKEVQPGRNWRSIDVKLDSTEALIIDVLD